MTLPTINTKTLLSTLATLAAAAAAAAVFATNAAAKTTGFHITNWSSHRIVLTKTTGDFEAPGTKPGLLLSPGASYDFEVDYGGQGDLYFDVLNEDEQPFASYHVHLITGYESLYDRESTCQITHWNGQCTAGNNVENLKVLDPPGTEYTIPAAKAQVQAGWFEQLCEHGDNGSTCSLDLTSEVHTWTDPHQVSDAIDNPYDEKGKYAFKIQNKFATKTSWGGEFSVGVAGKLFEAEIKVKYQHEVTEEHSVTETIEWEVPGHTRLYFAAIDPIIRDTGTFHIHLGNTEFTLPNVFFDSPDLSSGGWRDYIPVEQSICSGPTCS
jgi:hypothetical protein